MEDTQKIIATTWVNHVNPARQITIDGNNRFKINSDKFIISPLNASADLHIVSIHDGVEDDKILDTINAGEYTQIQGLVRNIELYVDTNETFYIKF